MTGFEYRLYIRHRLCLTIHKLCHLTFSNHANLDFVILFAYKEAMAEQDYNISIPRIGEGRRR